MKPQDIRQRNVYWEGDSLIYDGKVIVSLVKSEKYPGMYHLQFFWRNSKTPEIFNIINARENARIYGVQYINKICPEGSQEAH